MHVHILKQRDRRKVHDGNSGGKINYNSAFIIGGKTNELKRARESIYERSITFTLNVGALLRCLTFIAKIFSVSILLFSSSLSLFRLANPSLLLPSPLLPLPSHLVTKLQADGETNTNTPGVPPHRYRIRVARPRHLLSYNPPRVNRFFAHATLPFLYRDPFTLVSRLRSSSKRLTFVDRIYKEIPSQLDRNIMLLTRTLLKQATLDSITDLLRAVCFTK